MLGNLRLFVKTTFKCVMVRNRIFKNLLSLFKGSALKILNSYYYARILKKNERRVHLAPNISVFDL